MTSLMHFGWTPLPLRWLAVLAVAVCCASARAQDADLALHHWTFDSQDDAGAFADAVGNLTAKPQDRAQINLVDGKFGKAVNFTGQPNSFLSLSPITIIQKSSFSVAAWVNFATPGPNFILADWQNNSPGFRFGVNPLGSNKSTAQPLGELGSAEPAPPAGGPGGGGRRGAAPAARPSLVVQALANKPVPLNEWHHVVWTWDRDAGLLAFFMDGEMVAEQAKQTGLRSTDFPLTNQPMRIGSQAAAIGSAPPKMSGSVDELWVFGKALTPIEVRRLVKDNDIRAAVVAPAPPPVTPAIGTTTPPVTPIPTVGVSAGSPETSVVTRPEVREVRTPAKTIGSTSRHSGLRMTGIVTGLVMTVVLSCYLIWAVLERGKMRAAGQM